MTTTTSTSLLSSSNAAGLVVRCSTRVDGDFHLTEQTDDELRSNQRAFVDLPWTMTNQQHGVGVVRVESPGAGDGALGDIAITTLDDAVLGCWVGDCAPLVLIGQYREFAVVHAGWRGLAAGVCDAAVAAFDEPVVQVMLGPTIGPCCNEFGVVDLASVAAGVHAAAASVTATTSWGTVSLDVPAAVGAAFAHHDVPVAAIADGSGCTGCTFDGFSHRVRHDPQRHVVAAYRSSTAAQP
jgi:copper oxidase (laccase) domain-containing protein